MRAMADALVSTGLAKAGYNFVNIDGKCYSNSKSLCNCIAATLCLTATTPLIIPQIVGRFSAR